MPADIQAAVDRTRPQHHHLHDIRYPGCGLAGARTIAASIVVIAAAIVSANYLDQARKIMKTQALQQNLEEPNIEPRVQIRIVEPEKYNLVLRVPVPAASAPV